jgi:regulator of RNase E activity RraB
MPEDWNLFERNSGSEPMTLFMNTALKPIAPMEQMSCLISVVFNMYSLWDFAQHSSRGAQDLFYSLEDKLMQRMQQTEQAVYVGRISVQNKMEMYFYAKPSEDWESKLHDIMTDFPSFRYYTNLKLDESWSFYLEEMSPTPLEEQWMRNAKISYTLNRHGDDSEVVREVEHWLHFDSKPDMDEVKGKARLLGYHVMSAEHDPSRAMQAYVLQLRKKHAIDLVTVNQVTKELFTLASEAGGSYDGWGTRMKLRFPAKLRFMVLRFMRKPLYITVSLAIMVIAIAGVLLWHLI